MTLKVDGLREVLLRKTRDNENLHTLIKFMDKEILAEYALESLEKMAERSVKGSKLNTAAQDFARDLHPGHAEMIRDALSHHATKMNAALKSKNEDAASHHAKMFVNTMNSAQRLAPHSGGKLKVDAVDFKPWDQNNFPKHMRGEGKKRTDYTQAKGWHSLKGGDGKALLDSMLRGPHWSYEHSDTRTYNQHKDQPYPIHEVKINGKHLHIDDNHKYEGDDHSHEFDSHPIHSIIKSPDHALGSAERQKFLDAHHDFHAGEGGGQSKWISRHKQLRDSDPGYKTRGLEKPGDLSAHKRDSHKPERHDKHELGPGEQVAPVSQAAVEQKPVTPEQPAKAKTQPSAGSDIDWDAIPDDIRSMLDKYKIKK